MVESECAGELMIRETQYLDTEVLADESCRARALLPDREEADGGDRHPMHLGLFHQRRRLLGLPKEARREALPLHQPHGQVVVVVRISNARRSDASLPRQAARQRSRTDEERLAQGSIEAWAGADQVCRPRPSISTADEREVGRPVPAPP